MSVYDGYDQEERHQELLEWYYGLRDENGNFLTDENGNVLTSQ